MTENERPPLIPVFDGHNDTLLSLLTTGRDFFKESKTGHLDWPRAKRGGLVGGFFAVFVPDPKSLEKQKVAVEDVLGGDPDDLVLVNENGPTLAYAQQFAMAEIAALLRIETGDGTPYKRKRRLVTREGWDTVTPVITARDLKEQIEGGEFSAILHFEGAEMIDTNFNALETFYETGLRSLGIVWSRSNAFGHGVPFGFPSSPDTGPGLTAAGKALVKACNQLGIMVDVSHLNEAGFWDVVDTTSKPIVATHSNAHAICPSSRNLTDKQLAAIRDSDGIVGVNFNVSFLRPDGGRERDSPLHMMADHVDYLVDKVGLERVALGSDFDGALMPNDLSDASKVPNLMAVLRQRGYDDAALKMIGYQNWVRVLTATWAV
ncbi:MAG TPA: dipeptidase [Thermomicrobiales bacterium]|nr:dipeptidase [Thermomicrobiales bacterium]